MNKIEEGIIDKLIKAAENNEGIIIEFSADQVRDLVSMIAVNELKKFLLK